MRYRKCEGVSFDEIMKNIGKLLQKKCQPVKLDNHSLIINIVPVQDTVIFSASSDDDQWDLPYIFHLWPSVLLRSLLPYQITYSLEANTNKYETLEDGCSVQIHNAVLDQSKLKLQLINYLDQNWKSEYSIRTDRPEIDFITFSSMSELDKTELDIAVHVTYATGQMILEIHSPYWMVNKTGRMLQYKADGIHRKHPPNYKKPLLFSFQPKYFYQNNKIQLMVTDSELSDHFSLDTVGSHGSVKCKSHKKEYYVGVTIHNSSFNITRIVTLTTFFMITNRSKYTLEVTEEDQEKWIPVCIPFWPENGANKLLVRVENSEVPAKMVDFEKQENSLLLHLDNRLGGIIVDVTLAEHSTVIAFSDYHEGAAPFLLINHTKEEMIEYEQSSLHTLEDTLAPNKAVLYSWANPGGSRKMKWKCGKNSGEVTQKDVLVKTVGLPQTVYTCRTPVPFPQSESIWHRLDLMAPQKARNAPAVQPIAPSLQGSSKKKKMYLLSFFEGLQRIILFTEDERVFKVTYESEKIELAEQEIMISLSNVGISLVNNSTKQEVAFIGITSSDVVWEVKPKKKSRWKPMSMKQTEKLEREFKEYNDLSPSENKIVELETNIPVCLTPTGNCMKILQPNEIPLRRNFLPALKIEYSTSEHQTSFRVQIYQIQIQNQIHGAIFPFVFYPIKPPKSIVLDSEPKPFTDVSIVMRSAGHSQISRIKYFKVLIQEMDLRLDLGFLYALADLFTQIVEVPKDQEVELFKKDVEALQEELMSMSATDTSQISLYEALHISPIKAIKQMYVLILGLDVLGNPFGFIRSLSEGVEAFFYEPYQGAIQGPEEFVEGMALGLKALVGGAVGGLAGAASRITSAMAKGMAAITMDEDYQQKRREAMNKQPTGLREGLTRGGKGLVSVRNITKGQWPFLHRALRGGAISQKEGAAGFFKGVGKGLVGAVARPTGGIIDMASSTFQGIKRATDYSDGVMSLRPPRFFGEDGVIRPYRLREGAGSQMLQKIQAYREWSMSCISSDDDDDDDS
uniref:Vacuolar protein sorting 13 homolog A n=1 Tax=Sphenodon punctatus TaxID=8508 RepID=A0A8D0LAR4_SPHPU